MKRTAVLVFIVCFLSVASFASAAPFSSTLDWSPDITINNFYEYEQVVLTPTPAASVISATLSIRHLGNANWEFLGFGEVWLVRDSDERFIGKLGDSQFSWRTDTFALTGETLAELTEETPWSFEVKLCEGTYLDDHLKLDWSKIEGEYEPVPEPASMILLGSALAGLAARRKFKK